MGKHLKIICLFFFFCITTYISSFPVYAESSFDTSEIQISDLPDSFVNSISISDEEITGKSIRSFDVSSDNNIIISLSNQIHIFGIFCN